MSHETTNPIEVAVNAIETLGWQTQLSEDALFKDSVLFEAKEKYVVYRSTFTQHTKNVLHLELVVEWDSFPGIKRQEYQRLLNLINQVIAVGGFCAVQDEETQAEYLVLRAQLYLPNTGKITEDDVAHFLEDCVHSFDLCLPYISNFLAVKMQAFLGPSGAIEAVFLKMTPEDVIEFIFSGETIAYA